LESGTANNKQRRILPNRRDINSISKRRTYLSEVDHLVVDIVAIGEILVDFIPIKPGKYIQVPAFEQCFGGAPFNCAVAAARLGAKVGAIAAVGTDPFGEFLLETLRSNNVDVSEVKTKKARTTLAFVVSEASGERSFFFYRRPWVETADTLLSPGDITPAYLRGAKLLHYSGVALSHSPERDAIRRAVEEMRASGGLVSYDPNVRLDLWGSASELRAVNDEAMRTADIILLAKDEAELLLGTSDPQTVSTKIRKKCHPRYVAIKLGDEGSYVEDESRKIVSKPAFKVEVVDTTGAGDGWAGGFEFGLVKGFDLETCVTVANAVGALTLTKRGAITALPTRAELGAFLKERGVPPTDLGL
jgi:sugar/nucleoside kinase (ribokinase family)